MRVLKFKKRECRCGGSSSIISMVLWSTIIITSDIRVFKMSVPVMKSNPLSALIR